MCSEVLDTISRGSAAPQRSTPFCAGPRQTNSMFNILDIKRVSKSFPSPPKTSVDTGRMSSVQSPKVSALRQDRCLLMRRGQTPAVETKTDIEPFSAISKQVTSVMPQQRTSVLSQHLRLCLYNTLIVCQKQANGPTHGN